jgi:hypothetical protein
MMKLKWVFGALVLANLGLWMWASWYREAPLEETRAALMPVAPEKLRLLSEANVKLQPRKAPPPANAGLTANAAPACFHIGPFIDAALADKAGTKLKQWNLDFARRREDSRKISGYRVYLPPFASQKAAERKRQELTRLGFKDHALYQDENGRNAISLGLFSIEANADGRVRDLAAKGVKARVQALHEERRLFWLDIDKPVPAEVSARVKNADWGDKDARARETACAAGTNPPAPPAPENSITR